MRDCEFFCCKMLTAYIETIIIQLSKSTTDVSNRLKMQIFAVQLP